MGCGGAEPGAGGSPLPSRVPPPSLSHPGVSRGAGAGRDQHHRPGLRAALQTVPEEPPEARDAPRQVQAGGKVWGCPKWVLAGVAAHPCRPPPRMAGFDGSAWDEEEEEPAPDHQYYNDFPGKEPPIGGVVDMRLRDGAAQTPNHLGATLVRLWGWPRYKGGTQGLQLGCGLFRLFHESCGTCPPGTSIGPGGTWRGLGLIVPLPAARRSTVRRGLRPAEATRSHPR